MLSLTPQMSPWTRQFVLHLIQALKPSFFLTATVEELLFTGKENKISALAHLLSPKLQPDAKFYYLRGVNNSNDGLYRVNSGTENIGKLNDIVSINNQSHLSWWSGDECNRVQGANNGEVFPPLDLVQRNKNGTKILQLFRSDFCRVFNISLKEENIVSEIGRLVVDRFEPVEDMLFNSSINQANACYVPRSVEPPKMVDSKTFHASALKMMKSWFQEEKSLVRDFLNKTFGKFLFVVGNLVD